MPANSGYCSPGFSFAGQLQLNFKPNMQRRITPSLVSPRFIELRPIVAVGGLSVRNRLQDHCVRSNVLVIWLRKYHSDATRDSHVRTGMHLGTLHEKGGSSRWTNCSECTIADETV